MVKWRCQFKGLRTLVACRRLPWACKSHTRLYCSCYRAEAGEKDDGASAKLELSPSAARKRGNASDAISERSCSLYGYSGQPYRTRGAMYRVRAGAVQVFSSLADDHTHASFRTDGDERFHLYLLVGWQGELAFLG